MAAVVSSDGKKWSAAGPRLGCRMGARGMRAGGRVSYRCRGFFLSRKPGMAAATVGVAVACAAPVLVAATAAAVTDAASLPHRQCRGISAPGPPSASPCTRLCRPTLGRPVTVTPPSLPGVAALSRQPSLPLSLPPPLPLSRPLLLPRSRPLPLPLPLPLQRPLSLLPPQPASPPPPWRLSPPPPPSLSLQPPLLLSRPPLRWVAFVATAAACAGSASANGIDAFAAVGVGGL